MLSTTSLLAGTRRHFFQDCGVGLGTIALASLFNEGQANTAAPALVNPLTLKMGHHAAPSMGQRCPQFAQSR